MHWKLHRLYKIIRYRKTDARRYGHLSLEAIKAEGDEIEFVGWGFDRVHREMHNRRVVVKDPVGRLVFQAPLPGVKRKDTVTYIRDYESMHSGFSGTIRAVTPYPLKAYLEYESQGITYSTFFFDIKPNCSGSGNPEVEMVFPYPEEELRTKAEESSHAALIDIKEYEPVDVVVPVYNGMRFLPALFESIERTAVPFNLIIIDDASPDERVREFLDRFAAEHPTVNLLRNDENLGFLQSVNRGLREAEGDVVIVNTDVELPPAWLERIIRPILDDAAIASVTPFTNSGTICSFPRFCDDNHLQAGLDVDQMDRFFREQPLELFEVPTGVGFCMAMSREAIRVVGVFDEEHFGRGYAEENDWCQRAIKAGFKNVHVSNLFVFHNHGGSFQSDEKKLLVEEHLATLNRLHPSYNEDVATYVRRDPARKIRKAVERCMIEDSNAKSIVVLDHRLGGGATVYIDEKVERFIREGARCSVVRFDEGLNLYLCRTFLDGMEHSFSARDIGTMFRSFTHVDEIWVNELVTYQNISQLLVYLPALADSYGAKLIFPLHDFYCLCQSYNLINDKKMFCGLPEYGTCNACFHRIREGEFIGSGIDEYRLLWGHFLSRCDEIIGFSGSSIAYIKSIYPDLRNITFRPHVVESLPFIERKARMNENLTIGIMGMISYVKGRDVVKGLVDHINQEGLSVDIVIIGMADDVYPELKECSTGRYERDDIPEIALREGIDVFLIPSIWPETFSYTTAEIMGMGYPLGVFDLGAPAERVADYDRGVVIPQAAPPAEILATLEELAYDTVHIKDLPTRREESYLVIPDIPTDLELLKERKLHLLEEGILPEVITVSQMENGECEAKAVIVDKGLLGSSEAVERAEEKALECNDALQRTIRLTVAE